MNQWLQPLGLLAGAAAVGWPLTLVLPRLLRVLGLERTNYQGQPIGAGAGLLFWLASLAWLALAPTLPERAAALAASGFGFLGFLDDRWGTAEFKGLRGHFGALLRGRVTTGLLKALGGVALATVLAWQLRPGWPAAAAAPLIALAANLFNLLDLRPLRALKVFWLCALPLLGSGIAFLWVLVGLSVPYAVQEARRRVMLGDTGANLLGGTLGVATVLRLPVWAQALAAGLLLLFHLWAEKNSLSRWIEARAWARRLDGWGWRPADEGPGSASS